MIDVRIGDCRDILKEIPDSSVNCCVTSPPYFGLRDFGHEKQIGLEASPEEYVQELVEVFGEVRRVLRDDGTLWLNLGDSYANNGPGGCQGKNGQRANRRFTAHVPAHKGEGLKPKDLIGIPWRVAFALQADGWYLRQDIIWHKPNPMPESVKDRCTKAHEYIFLMSKSSRYYFNQEAILEPCSPATHARLSQKTLEEQAGSTRAFGGTKHNGPMKAACRKFDLSKGNKNNQSFDAAMAIMPENRNKRSVWTVTTQPFKGSHFATFPLALVEPCIMAGCPEGGIALDPFGGSGTVGEFCRHNNRNAILIELNPEYAGLIKERGMLGYPELSSFTT
jgi:DNA modification methylase